MFFGWLRSDDNVGDNKNSLILILILILIYDLSVFIYFWKKMGVSGL